MKRYKPAWERLERDVLQSKPCVKCGSLRHTVCESRTDKVLSLMATQGYGVRQAISKTEEQPA